jgi:hypothetical protein
MTMSEQEVRRPSQIKCISAKSSEEGMLRTLSAGREAEYGVGDMGFPSGRMLVRDVAVDCSGMNRMGSFRGMEGMREDVADSVCDLCLAGLDGSTLAD